jgi:hypothetical protein
VAESGSPLSLDTAEQNACLVFAGSELTLTPSR